MKKYVGMLFLLFLLVFRDCSYSPAEEKERNQGAEKNKNLYNNLSSAGLYLKNCREICRGRKRRTTWI